MSVATSDAMSNPLILDQTVYQEALNAEINRILLQSPTPILPPCIEALYNPDGIKTLVLRNIPRTINNEDLMNIFDKHGVIVDIYIPTNKNKNSPYFGTVKGFAMVTFLTVQEATRAFMAESIHRLSIHNNKIAIEFAKENRRK